jgi:hypothetical protein
MSLIKEGQWRAFSQKAIARGSYQSNSAEFLVYYRISKRNNTSIAINKSPILRQRINAKRVPT